MVIVMIITAAIMTPYIVVIPNGASIKVFSLTVNDFEELDAPLCVKSPSQDVVTVHGPTESGL